MEGIFSDIHYLFDYTELIVRSIYYYLSMYIRNSFFCSEKNSNSRDLLAADEGGLGNWSSLINYNSSVDSSIRETDYEDRTSPDNAL